MKYPKIFLLILLSTGKCVEGLLSLNSVASLDTDKHPHFLILEKIVYFIFLQLLTLPMQK